MQREATRWVPLRGGSLFFLQSNYACHIDTLAEVQVDQKCTKSFIGETSGSVQTEAVDLVEQQVFSLIRT